MKILEAAMLALLSERMIAPPARKKNLKNKRTTSGNWRRSHKANVKRRRLRAISERSRAINR